MLEVKLNQGKKKKTKLRNGLPVLLDAVDTHLTGIYICRWISRLPTLILPL